jgi:Fe-Mn family superoxide dismutase
MAQILMKLPYGYDALEPFIDAKTMEIHHLKHHQTYVDKFNTTVKGSQFEDEDVDEVLKNIDNLPEEIRKQVINFGGGVSNHNFFWKIIGPNSGGEPTGILADAIDEEFGSFQQFHQKFSESAKNLFGSGWTWLVIDNGKLEIVNTMNQTSPLSEGKIPLLCIDVWEHAYYLKYQNKRAEYVDNWWNVINWEKVEELYESI